MADKPKLTKKMTMHLNGGNKYSSLTYQVYADDKPTEIYQYRQTNGRPHYKITQDLWKCGDDEFDALANGNKGLLDWLHTHAPSETGDQQT